MPRRVPAALIVVVLACGLRGTNAAERAATPSGVDRSTAPTSTAATSTAPKPIPPRRSPSSAGGTSSSRVVTAVASLAIVAGLFLVVVWVLRRHLPGGSAMLPSDVFEVLGRGTAGPKQPVQLVRLGDRLLLLSVMADRMQTLAEITDPDEVTRLAGLCRQARPDSASTAFRQMFHQQAHRHDATAPPSASKVARGA